MTVTCPAPQPTASAARPPSRPIAFNGVPSTLSRTTKIQFNATAEAGVKTVELFLGARRICTLTAAPFGSCDVTATGADVGRQALRAVVTDALGSTAQATVNVTVAKFATKVTTKIQKTKVKGNKVKRTIRGKIAIPAARHQGPGVHRQGHGRRSSAAAGRCSTSRSRSRSPARSRAP